MEERKKCQSCGAYLVAFQGHYLHPDTPCAGVKDCIFIEASIEDEVLHKKFEEIYGKPDMDDYDRLSTYEKTLLENEKTISDYERILNHPIVRFICKVFRLRL